MSVRPGVSVGIGDDAAVLTGDPAIVATHDLLIEGVHFRRETTGPEDLGHRCLAVNLSDLAAMGAEPVAALVGLGLPANGSTETTDGLYRGMEALAARVGATIAGGDISASPTFVVAVTAIGRIPAGRGPVRRSEARPGDVLAVTGSLGGSAAGLAVLDDPSLSSGIDEDAAREALRRHRRPEARLAEGRLLAEAGATAMLDISDGLGVDAERLARSSDVAIEIDLDRLPIDPSAAALASALGSDPRLMAWSGGEDYELLVALPPATAERTAASLPAGLTVIGHARAGAPSATARVGGEPLAVEHSGYLHHV